MTKVQHATIQLLNKKYTIKCTEAEASYLENAVEVLNHHLLNKKKQFPHLEEYKVLLLAALQVSHDYVVDNQKHREQHKQLSQLIGLLENKVNDPVA